MLADLQSFIAKNYDADCGHRLHDFLITDRALATVLGRKTLPGNTQLREFYRLTQAEKMSYIHTLAWEN